MRPIDRALAGPWADALIDEFGSLGAALAASPPAQARILPSGAARRHLRTTRAALLHLLRGEAMTGPRLTDGRALADYLKLRLADEGLEHLRVIYMGSGNRFLRDERLAEGSIEEVTVDIRKILARALELRALGLILVHNHPSGDPTPSRADIAATRRMAEAGAILGVTIHDHVIVARTGCASLRGLGLI